MSQSEGLINNYTARYISLEKILLHNNSINHSAFNIKGDSFGSESITLSTTPNEYLQLLRAIDSRGYRSEHLTVKFEVMARAYPELHLKVLDLIFESTESHSFGLGRLIKSKLVIGSTKAGVNSRNALNYYASLISKKESVYSEDVLRCFITSFPGYTKNVLLFSTLANSNHNLASLFAIKYAHESILPYLVNTKNINAKRLLEKRLDEIPKGES